MGCEQMNTYVFVTNYYNHHQAFFAREMDKQTEHRFYFIETKQMSEERKKMGWGQEQKPSYVLQSYLNPETKRKCENLIKNADVVIWGSCPFSMIRQRLKKKKITFAYSERIFKKGYHGFEFWGRAIKYFLRLALYQKNHYLLCASAYAASDYEKIGLFRNRTFKWGYFPEMKQYDLDKLFIQKDNNKRSSILWVARLIELKHPEAVILLAEGLKEKGYLFDIDLIGNGVLESKIKTMIEERDLGDCVHMLGAMSPREVRTHMEKTNIFLFTSDQNEGWGAVLNESMNSGCAVVANRSIGSVPFLIEHGVNGLLYQSQQDLQDRVEELLKEPVWCRKIGTMAYQTIVEEWNAKAAVSNFLKLINSDMNVIGRIQTGPCSEAKA